MPRVSALPRCLAAILAVIPLGVAAFPALASEREEFEATREAWTTTEDLRAETVAGLEALDAAMAEATVAYAEVEQRLADATARQRELRVELGEAVVEERRAEAANDVAIRRLGQATMVLVTIEESLAHHAADLDVEIVAAYKHAGASAQFTGIVDALIRSQSITDFTTAYEQLQATTVGQKRLVDAVTALAGRLLDQRVIVAELQRQTAEAKREASRHRRRVAQLNVEQEQLVIQVRADRRDRQRLVEELEAQQAAFTARAAELEAQSVVLMEELRQYRYIGGAPGSKDLLWPTDGEVTSPFGYRTHPIYQQRRLHAGIDIPAPTGQPIFAAADATVVGAGPRGGYGNAVVLDHGDGMTSVYAHQSRVDVSVGDEVIAGDTIGYVGSTGFSTGPHLHFEIRLGGAAVDPLDWY